MGLKTRTRGSFFAACYIDCHERLSGQEVLASEEIVSREVAMLFVEEGVVCRGGSCLSRLPMILVLDLVLVLDLILVRHMMMVLACELIEAQNLVRPMAFLELHYYGMLKTIWYLSFQTLYKTSLLALSHCFNFDFFQKPLQDHSLVREYF